MWVSLVTVLACVSWFIVDIMRDENAGPVVGFSILGVLILSIFANLASTVALRRALRWTVLAPSLSRCLTVLALLGLAVTVVIVLPYFILEACDVLDLNPFPDSWSQDAIDIIQWMGELFAGANAFAAIFEVIAICILAIIVVNDVIGRVLSRSVESINRHRILHEKKLLFFIGATLVAVAVPQYDYRALLNFLR
jgi:hypothetical protein